MLTHTSILIKHLNEENPNILKIEAEDYRGEKQDLPCENS